MNKKFVVIEEMNDHHGHCSMDEHVFECMDDAESFARREWDHLTESERLSRELTIGEASLDDDGCVDFGTLDVIRVIKVGFVIRATFQGGREHHLWNPLTELDGIEFDSREEACEAIYEAMYGVIIGNGCEMVQKPAEPNSGLVVCDEEEYANVAMVFRAGSVPSIREYCRDSGFDNWEDEPDEIPLPIMRIEDYLYDHKFSTRNMVACDGVTDDDIERAVCACRDYEDYADDCREFIYREGWATEDGVSVRVEEIA